jgi:hypothetical protein
MLDLKNKYIFLTKNLSELYEKWNDFHSNHALMLLIFWEYINPKKYIPFRELSK